MRDANRIPKFLTILASGWANMPDIRFGQLIENIKKHMGKEDLFYIEDDEMAVHIINYFSSTKGENTLYSAGEICPSCGVYSADGGVCTHCQKEYGIYKPKNYISDI